MFPFHFHCNLGHFRSLHEMECNIPDSWLVEEAIGFLAAQIALILLFFPRKMVIIIQSIILWKHYLNLVSQSFQSVSSDLHQC